LSFVSVFKKPFKTTKKEMALYRYYDDLFQTPFKLTQQSKSNCFVPVVDIQESDREYSIHMELAGVNKNDVEIKFESGVLTISGSKKNEVIEENSDKHYRHVERSFGSFSRQFRLSDNVDPNGIKAQFENNVLSVSVPKQEIRKSINIEIH
jgi:HSP20 family protein